MTELPNSQIKKFKKHIEMKERIGTKKPRGREERQQNDDTDDHYGTTTIITPMDIIVMATDGHLLPGHNDP